MSKSSSIAVTVIVAIIAAGGGFFGGMQYQKGKQPTGPSFQRNGNFAAFRNGNFNGRVAGGFGGGIVRGTVTAISGTTMTVQESNGSSKIILLSSSTTVSKTSSAATSDLTVGATVQASGTSNSDGSVTATTVELNPIARLGAPTGTDQAPPAQ